MDALIVEVHPPDGPVQRVRLSQFPASLGRGYDTDVIVDDPYVCALHLRLTRDEQGALWAVDVGSVNGTFCDGTATRVAQVPITPGLRLRVGRTRVRFYDPHTAVAPALVDGERGTSPPWMLRWPQALAICAAALAVVGIDAYQGSIVPQPLRSAGSSLLVVSALGLGWATIWAFITRVLSQRWRLLGHAAVVSACVIGIYAISALIEYYAFVFSSTTAIGVAGAIAGALLLAFLFNSHLSLVSPLPPRRRRAASVLVALLLTGSVELIGWLSQDRFSPGLEFADTLKPVPVRWLPTESVEEFLADLDSLKTDVDELAAKKPAETSR